MRLVESANTGRRFLEGQKSSNLIFFCALPTVSLRNSRQNYKKSTKVHEIGAQCINNINFLFVSPHTCNNNAQIRARVQKFAKLTPSFSRTSGLRFLRGAKSANLNFFGVFLPFPCEIHAKITKKVQKFTKSAPSRKDRA